MARVAVGDERALERLLERHEAKLFAFIGRQTGGRDVSDKVTGLEIGADDYVTKPFDLEELMLRIEAVRVSRKATPEDLLDRGYRQVGASFPVFLHPDSGEEYALATNSGGIAVVRVTDPYATTDDRPPLFVGSFAQVEIDARRLDSYMTVPTDALREAASEKSGGSSRGVVRNVVWLVENDRIRIQPVDVLKARDEVAIITGGLDPGDRVITSDLGVVTDSMAVRTLQDEEEGS